jgi:hypothetical protein
LQSKRSLFGTVGEYQVGWEAINLTDGIIYENGWCSAQEPTEDHEFVFSFRDGQEAILNEAIIYGGIADETYYSKDVEVWTSTDGTNYTFGGSDVLLDVPLDSLIIDLADTLATNVKLVITSGYATGTYYNYWELGEFVVTGYISDPGDPETEITMTAATAGDPSGVEYFFDCNTPGGHDSGWQDDVEYTDTGLDPGTEYCYTVTARDKATAQNTGAASGTACATTTGDPPVVTCDNTCGDLDGSGVNANGFSVDLADFAKLAGCWDKDPSTNTDCICANLVEDSDDIIDLLDLRVFVELFLSTSSDYPPDCSGSSK